MPPETVAACGPCLRRTVLLAALSARIDHSAVDLDRVLELLQLDDDTLICTLGGKRRQELHELSRRFGSARLALPTGVCTICPHAPGFAVQPAFDALPHALFLAGSLQPLHSAGQQLASAAAAGLQGGHEHRASSHLGATSSNPHPPLLAAIVGCQQPSDYGRQIAHQLSAELAAAGVTVASVLTEGVGVCALAGALHGGGGPVAISPSGLSSTPAHLHGLRRRVAHRGCVTSLLPGDAPARRWSRRAALATLAQMSSLVLLVEDRYAGYEHQLARLARRRRIAVGAIPGRLGARCSAAPHALIRDGVPLVRGAQDALDLLYGDGSRLVPSSLADTLPPSVVSVLDRVAGGQDTLASLLEAADPARTLLAVAQLEALRLVVRGPGGRYVACAPSRPACDGAVG